MLHSTQSEWCPGPVAVTGATGHVGNVLVRELAGRGVQVRAIVPPGEGLAPLAGLDVEVCRADVRDRAALGDALVGCRQVYHLAGLVTTASGRRSALEAVNVRGTRNVAEAALEKRVGRLVYTSSIHALVEPADGRPMRPAAVFEPDRLLGDYAWSKARASQEVLAAVDRGLDAVLVFPTGIVGPFDFRLSDMGRLFLSCARGRLRAYVDGAYDFVDVRDVVDGTIAAMERGRRGEGYLLAGHRVTVRRMLEVLQQASGARLRARRLPFRLAQLAAALAPAWYRLSRQRPLLNSYSLKVLRSNCAVDVSKSLRELGFGARPFAETVRATLDWFRSVGMLSPA